MFMFRNMMSSSRIIVLVSVVRFLMSVRFIVMRVVVRIVIYGVFCFGSIWLRVVGSRFCFVIL